MPAQICPNRRPPPTAQESQPISLTLVVYREPTRVGQMT
jgi:hypothetical protein